MMIVVTKLMLYFVISVAVVRTGIKYLRQELDSSV